MQTAFSMTAKVAAICLWLNAILVVDHFLVEPEQCLDSTFNCFYSPFFYLTVLLILIGALALIVMALLAAIHAGQQRAWAAGLAFLLLVGLSITGALAIVASSELSWYLGRLGPLNGTVSLNPLNTWVNRVVPALLLALAAVPGLVLSRFPLRRAPLWFMRAFAPAACVTFFAAGAALWFFQFGYQDPAPVASFDGDPLDVIVAAAPQLFGTLTLFLACWLLGSIALILSLLRRVHAPAAAASMSA